LQLGPKLVVFPLNQLLNNLGSGDLLPKLKLVVFPLNQLLKFLVDKTGDSVKTSLAGGAIIKVYII
jgi:hypothetical protein